MKNVKLLVMDVDGTLTDGKIYMGANGEIMKAFNIKDGYGIKDMLPRIGVYPVIITGRESAILQFRCKELGISMLYQGVCEKKPVLQDILLSLSKKLGEKLSFKNVAYIGDDYNDIECMKLVKEYGGIVACPSDAIEQVQEISNYVSYLKGGEGAVRDFIEWLYKGIES